MRKQLSFFKNIVLTILLFFCINPIYAQPPFWKLNGNPNIGPDIVTPANNFFGTDILNPTNVVRMGTFGWERIRMQGLPAGLLQPYPASLLNPLPDQLTRVSIPRDGNVPIKKPLSLLHLGYESPTFMPPGTAGYRSWQDLGTMYMAQTDNFYTGLRQKKSSTDPTGRTSEVTSSPTDAQDAVISWGDNYTNNPPFPDNNLAFIFHAPLNPAYGFAGFY